MKAHIATQLPFPVRLHGGAPAAPPRIFARAAAPPDLLETASAAVIAGVAVLHAAFMVMLVVSVVSG